jgi:hypothetical protein
MLQQLTFDPMQGFSTALNADGPVVLAFSGREVLGAQIAGQQARRTANTMYYVPFGMTISGKVSFASDLIRSTIIGDESPIFDKQPNVISMGAGTITVAYRPIDFEGRLTASEVRLALNPGGEVALPPVGKPIDPLGSMPPTCPTENGQPQDCQAPRLDLLPDVEVLDLVTGKWVRLPRLEGGSAYSLSGPERFVDAGSGQLLVRFLNDNAQQTLSFGFQVAITGVVE